MSAPIADCVDDSSRAAQCGDDWSISPVLHPTRIELGLGVRLRKLDRKAIYQTPFSSRKWHQGAPFKKLRYVT